MRWPAAGALACALAVASLCAAPAPARTRPHAAILFLPAAREHGQPLLFDLARRRMAIGMTSPTVGGFDRRQMALDMSQGARIPTGLYSKEIGSLKLRHTRSGWELAQWGVAGRRARDAPGKLVPGLLASTAERAGLRVEYVGIVGRYALGAIVAADERGHVSEVSVGQAATAPQRLAKAFRSHELVVADLPPGRAALRALDRVLAERGPSDVVYAVRTPAGEQLHLLASGLAAPGVAGQLRSASTRRNGLITATDVAPTILARLGVAAPAAMQGERIEGRGRADLGAVRSEADRLAVLTARRGYSLRLLAGGWGALAIVLAFAAGARGFRAALRIGLLAALWVPGLALLTAAMAPSRLKESVILAAGSLALGTLTDRLVRWPGAPAVPAAAVLLAHSVDLARGSPLIGRSIAGPNPAGGARFFGIGNELETMLSFAVLVGTGAALAWAARREPDARDPEGPGYQAPDAIKPRDWQRLAPFGFGLAALIAAAVMGAGRLGADVGAVITLGAGGAAAVVAALGGRLSRRRLALAVAAPVLAVGLLVAIDLVTAGGAHLTRSVLNAHGTGDIADVVRRRFQGSFTGLRHPGQAAVFAVALVIVAGLGAGHRRILRPLAGVRGGVWLRAGLIGAFFAVLTGALSNDSGPLILEIGAVLLALGAGYAAANPERPGIQQDTYRSASRRSYD